MIPDLLIALSEVQKLGLLYLAFTYGYTSTTVLIFSWILWQLISSIVFGKISDIKGRKYTLSITVIASIIVSLLALMDGSFLYALLVNGIFVATLPVAFAAKNDQHPNKSKRHTYAEASLSRALPWFIVPLIYLQTGMPEDFWIYSMVIGSLASGILIFFFYDKQDKSCVSNPDIKHPNQPILCSFVLLILVSFFFAECSYQTIAYMTEEKEKILRITKSYMLFGAGMSATSALHLLFKKIEGVSLRSVCSSTFFVIFFYFLIKYASFSWQEITSTLSFTEKTILGVASGIYIPLVYAIVCERYKIHQQGVLCGVLECTATLAEIVSPAISFLLIFINLSQNTIFLIIGLGFFVSYVIMANNHLISRVKEWLKAVRQRR